MQRSSINKVILVGRVGNKPEGRFTPSGTSTVSFSIATNEVWGTDDKRQEHTEWHNLVAWNKTADFVSKYIQKGQLIAVEGSLRTRSWTDKEEKLHKVTEVLCNSVTPLEWKSEEPAESSSQVSDENEEELPF
ncbi:MAG: single-stranded DNA-binding protein [FCB group bacterium]|nr:single-stranded DNA-binding protein [FCB group bacterium]